jgi:aspartate ammonia-lyase
MNVNEVLANRGLVALGHQPGSYAALHPNDHVNLSQSTNDVIPTAIRMACHERLGATIAELGALADAFEGKARVYADALRLGRTCLQDAQPMMLGQALGAHACAVRRCAAALDHQRAEMLDLPLGGTAIGTGFGAAPGYREQVFDALRKRTGVDWRAADTFDGLANADGYARLSGELRNAAGALGKIANDFQILASGPSGGLAELKLPAVQPGSSIMPGKVNPVIPIAVRQVAFAVSGYDAIVAAACQDGQLEINPYEPVIALHLFLQLDLLAQAARLFGERCVAGLEADREAMRRHLDASAATATTLLPTLGYEATAKLVRAAQAQGRPFADLVVEGGHMTREGLEDVLLRSVGP